MARKSKDERKGKEPELKVVGGSDTPQEPAKPAKSAKPPPETIFHDKRTGRDRREDAPKVEDSRRQAKSERRASKMKGAWWLARDYVESHHFVQKSPGSRRRRDENTGDE